MNASVQSVRLSQPLFQRVPEQEAARHYSVIAWMMQDDIGITRQQIQQQIDKLLDGRSLMYEHRDSQDSVIILEHTKEGTVHINYAQGSYNCPITKHWPTVEGMALTVGARQVTTRTYRRSVARLARRYGFVIAAEEYGYIDLVKRIAE